MGSPFVSIIIPLYNAENYIAETIRSATEQTWPNKEIIIVDDGSTDSSFAIAKTFESSIIKVYGQANKGASAARNTGLQYAKGDYVQFLDADDLLSPDKIERQVTGLRDNPDKVAVCSTVHFDDGALHADSRPSAYEEAFLFDDDDPAHFLINLWGGYQDNGSMITVHAWLTPRHIIEKAGFWNEQLTVDDDGEFFCRVLLHSKGIVKTGGYNYYRKYPHNVTSLSANKTEKDYSSLYNSLRMRYELISQQADSFELKKAYIKSLYSLQFNMYPRFPQLRKSIAGSIEALNINIPDPYSRVAKGKKLLLHKLKK